MNRATEHFTAEFLSLALDGAIIPEELELFERHQQSCELCRRRWLKWQRFSSLLQTEPLVGPVPGFAVRVDRQLQARQVRRERLLGGLLVVGGTVSVWTLLLVGLIVTTAVWLVVSPMALVQGIDLVVFLGQLAALTVRNLTAIRNAALQVLPAPLVVAVTGLGLTVALILWARLVGQGRVRSAGLVERQ